MEYFKSTLQKDNSFKEFDLVKRDRSVCLIFFVLFHEGKGSERKSSERKSVCLERHSLTRFMSRLVCGFCSVFSAECTIGMVRGLTPLKHYGTMALCRYGTM